MCAASAAAPRFAILRSKNKNWIFRVEMFDAFLTDFRMTKCRDNTHACKGPVLCNDLLWDCLYLGPTAAVPFQCDGMARLDGEPGVNRTP